MKPFRGVAWACALGFLGAGASPAHAAWCNVFQVCCNTCGQPAVSSYAPAPCCAPQPVCTTHYEQRCYYQPVTAYTTRSYYEPVTTYRTSYYWEPVTSYRYSSYYDPCTCCFQQVACPTTSYQLRSQCCPVQSWVQRCCSVPVTTYQRCSYWEPVTTCCAPPPPPCCPAPAPAAPCSAPAPAPAPAVTEQRTAPAPGVQETPQGQVPSGSGSPLYDRYYPPQGSPMPNASGSSYRQAPPQLPVITPAPAPVNNQPPSVRLDRIVAVPVPTLQGQVVRRDRGPESGAQLVFVSESERGQQQNVTTDESGNFRVTLGSGAWLVYVNGDGNRPVFHSKIDVRDNETRQVTLVSR